jgi:hypothetical protein
MYNKKVLIDSLKNLNKVKSPVKKKDVIVDPMGQWNHPGEITRIPGRYITMSPDPRTGEPLKQPLLGISDKGEKQMMFPGGEYVFEEGTKYVDERPVLKKFIKQLGGSLPKAQVGFGLMGKPGKTLSENLNVLDDLYYGYRGRPYGGYNFKPTIQIDKMTKGLLSEPHLDLLSKGLTYGRAGDVSKYLGDFNFKFPSEGYDATQKMLQMTSDPQWQPSQEDFFTNDEFTNLIEQEKNYIEAKKKYDQMDLSSYMEPDKIGDYTIMKVPEGLFESMFPNVSRANFRSKLLTPKQEKTLWNFTYPTGSNLNPDPYFFNNYTAHPELIGDYYKARLAMMSGIKGNDQILEEATTLKEYKDNLENLATLSDEDFIDMYANWISYDLLKGDQRALDPSERMDIILDSTPEQISKWRAQITQQSYDDYIKAANNYERQISRQFTGKDAWKQITDETGYKNQYGGLVKAQGGGNLLGRYNYNMLDPDRRKQLNISTGTGWNTYTGLTGSLDATLPFKLIKSNSTGISNLMGRGYLGQNEFGKTSGFNLGVGFENKPQGQGYQPFVSGDVGYDNQLGWNAGVHAGGRWPINFDTGKGYKAKNIDGSFGWDTGYFAHSKPDPRTGHIKPEAPYGSADQRWSPANAGRHNKWAWGLFGDLSTELGPGNLSIYGQANIDAIQGKARRGDLSVPIEEDRNYIDRQTSNQLEFAPSFTLGARYNINTGIPRIKDIVKRREAEERDKEIDDRSTPSIFKEGGLPKAQTGDFIKRLSKLYNVPALSGVKKDWSGNITKIYNPYFKKFEAPLTNLSQLTKLGDSHLEGIKKWESVVETDKENLKNKILQINNPIEYETLAKELFQERFEQISAAEEIMRKFGINSPEAKEARSVLEKLHLPFDPVTMSSIPYDLLSNMSDQSESLLASWMDKFNLPLDEYNLQKAIDQKKIDAYRNAPLSYKLFGLSPGWKVADKIAPMMHPYYTDILFPLRKRNKLGTDIYDSVWKDQFDQLRNLRQFHPWSRNRGEKYIQYENDLEKYDDLNQRLIDIIKSSSSFPKGDDPFESIKRDVGELPKAQCGGTIIRNLLYKGINPASYNITRKIKNFPRETYLNAISNSTRPFRVGESLRLTGIPEPTDEWLKTNYSGLSFDKYNKLPVKEKMKLFSTKHLAKLENLGRRRLDAWATGLGLPQEYNTLEQIGDNTYRMLGIQFDPVYMMKLHNDLKAKYYMDNPPDPVSRGTLSTSFIESPLVGLTRDYRKMLRLNDPRSYSPEAIKEILERVESQQYYPEWVPERHAKPIDSNTGSVWDWDNYGVMGGYRWDISEDPRGLLFTQRDLWDLKPFEKRGETRLVPSQVYTQALQGEPKPRKYLENLEMLGLVGGKPFNIENNYLVDPKTYQILDKYKDGGELPKAQGGGGTKALVKALSNLTKIPSNIRNYRDVAFKYPKIPLFQNYSNILSQTNLDDGWVHRMNMAQTLKDTNYVGDEFDQLKMFNAAKTDEAMNALMRQAISHDLTGWRQVKPRLQASGSKYSNTGLKQELLSNEELQQQHEAMIEAGVDFNDPKSISAYFATHIPFQRYGDREGGLEHLDSYGADAIYLSARPEKNTYGPHMWRVRQPFDFSTGNWLDWYAQHILNKKPIIFPGTRDFNPALRDSQSVFFDTGYSKGNIVEPSIGIGQGLNTRRWASGKGVKVAEPDIDPDNPFPAFYDYMNLTPEERQLIKLEQDAVEKGFKTGWSDKYQKGGPVVKQSKDEAIQSPEAWEQEIRAIEKQIGDPSGWTMEDYYLLQDKLNAYKDWRENTPEGQAVVDYHNEEGEYDVELPKHLQNAMNAMMKARLAYANEFGNPSAKRMVVAPDQPYVYTGEEYDKDFDRPAGVPAGNIGTHYMADFDNYAVPFIQQGPKGLYFNESPSISDKEAIRFDSPEDARYFSKYYKEVAPDPSYREEENIPETYNLQRALELGYTPDETGHMPSVDEETGMWLKSMDHPTAWKEYLYGSLNRELGSNYNVRVNPEGYFGDKQLQYIEAELDSDEIQKYIDGGYIVEDLPKAQTGKEVSKILSKVIKTPPPPSIPKIPTQLSKLPVFYPNQFMTTSNLGKFTGSPGDINLDQLKAAIGKESMGLTHKWPILERQLVKEFGEDMPVSLPFSEIQRITNDAIVPYTISLNPQGTYNYGVWDDGGVDHLQGVKRLNLGFTKPKTKDNWINQEYFDSLKAAMEKRGSGVFTVEDLESIANKLDNPEIYEPLFQQTSVLSGLGEGTQLHNNPEGTLAAAHSYIDPDTPNTRTYTQFQSDALQGTHHIWKNKEKEIEKIKKQILDLENDKANFLSFGKDADAEEAANNIYQDPINTLKKKIVKLEEEIIAAKAPNPKQKELLEKNWESVLLQQLMTEAATEGMTKIRVPTGETTIKIQNYHKRPQFTEEDWTDVQNIFEADNFEEAIANNLKNNKPTKLDYSNQQKTVIRRYDKLPKTLKKSFGLTNEQIKIVTDRLGNTWFEVEIPESFLLRQGQIIHKSGGSVNIGDEVDEATMQRLLKEGYTFEEI